MTRTLFLFAFLIGYSLTSDAQRKNTGTDFNIADYGAIGDGKTLNTRAINKTIEACSKSGGGTVHVPAGRFLTGTVHLKSNITLHLEHDATIIGTADLQHYQGSNLKKEDPEKPINIDVKDIYSWTRALIMLENAENVTIAGTGTIDGALVPKPERNVHGIMIISSKNVTISDIRVTRAANWSIVGLYVEEFKVTNVTITDGYDGIHVRHGKNLVIDNCKFYCRDDAIAGGYWENTLITECLINSACNGIRIILPTTNLEIKACDIIGPGVFGHFRGSVNNPLTTNTLTGIIFQPGAWGLGKGKSEKIYIHDIKIKDVQTAMTFVLNEGNTANDILVERVKASGIYNNACSVETWAKGSSYENIRFKDIDISYKVTAPEFINVKNFERPRTESRPLPYWGFYIRNVNNIGFENVKLDYSGAEARPAFGFDQVKTAVLKNVKYKAVPGVEPLKYTETTSVKLIGSGPM
ncbi:glycoside hydrolase family 28 protein [Dyadobacter bucti]|uniref:glycoside hydrolase family 28 protein n=1 Tax=Dyadobacter bucti TaxID=2572203 RepID=UPI001109C7A5|nr:glycosyl hydrolase family 28-related protein [Dyadobacter bucti]